MSRSTHDRMTTLEKNPQSIGTIVALFALFEAAGLVGLNLEFSAPWFMSLRPLYLLISAVVLGFFHSPWNQKFGIFLFIGFWLGFAFALLSVQTGIPLGKFSFGPSLGVKIGGVPVLIGLQLTIWVYTCGVLVSELSIPRIGKILISAFLLTLLFSLTQSMATQSMAWAWEDPNIRVLSYLGWFVVALVLEAAYHFVNIKAQNPFVLPWLIIQFFFYTTFLVIKL